jgi:hypothetical protein
MPLFCSNCSTPADSDSPYCARCGSDLVPSDRLLRGRALVPLVRRHDVVVDRIRVNCIAYGERLRHDPLTETVASVFSCGRDQERIDCVGCRVCTTCGDLSCTCGLLSISIGVKIKKGTVIETVPLRPRLL